MGLWAEPIAADANKRLVAWIRGNFYSFSKNIAFLGYQFEYLQFVMQYSAISPNTYCCPNSLVLKRGTLCQIQFD